MKLLKAITRTESPIVPRRTTRTSTTLHWSQQMFLAVLFVILLVPTTTFLSETFSVPPFACAKELVATREWQEVKEGDTIPKGLHVRMDFKTGTKWVKLLEEEETAHEMTATEVAPIISTAGSVTATTSRATSSKDSVSGPKITQLTNLELTPEASAKITNTILDQEKQRTANYIQSVASLNDFEHGHHDNELDYEMMYRALQSLPEGELGMDLPPSLPDENESSINRQEFEATIRDIWRSRQELLKRMEDDHLANIPDLIQDRVKFLEGYIVLPVEHLRHTILSRGKEESEAPDNIISVLEDLEFHVADIDMARDFHSMGGLPLLVSLLTDSIHGLDRATNEAIQFTMEGELNNSTSTISHSEGFELKQETLDYLEQMQETIWKVQSLACWTIGTAVKNTEEFWGWALEDFSDLTSNTSLGSDQSIQDVNLVSILTTKMKDTIPLGSSQSFMKLKQKEIYALGSILRGNRKALQFFVSIGGATILGQSVTSIFNELDSDEVLGSITSNFLSKAVILANDLVMDVLLNPISSENGQEMAISEQMDKDVIKSFTTDEWCSLPLQTIQIPSAAIKRKMLQTIVDMSLHCSYGNTEFHRVEESVFEHKSDDDFVELLQQFHKIVESR